MTIQQKPFDGVDGSSYNCPAMVSDAPEKFNPVLIARKASGKTAGGQANTALADTADGEAVSFPARDGTKATEVYQQGPAQDQNGRQDADCESGSVSGTAGIQLGAARTGFERFSVVLPLSRFKKLQDVTQNTEGELHAVFDLGFNDQHQVIAEGMMDVRVKLQCQRCLAEYAEDLSGPFSLVLVADEAAADRLSDELDPVVLDEDGMTTSVNLLEDELVLRVPVVPRHADAASCEFDVAVELLSDASTNGDDDSRTNRQGGVGENGDVAATGSKPGTQRPFSVLKDLKLN